MRKTGLLVLLQLLVLTCGREPPKREPLTLPVKEQVDRVVVTETRWGKPQWRLETQRILAKKDSTIVYDVSLWFYDEDGNQTSFLVSDSGIVIEDTRDLIALGNVKVITQDSSILYTKRLIWINEKQIITTPDSVLIIRHGRKLKGVGLTSDAKLSRIKIGGKVVGEQD